MRDSSLTRKVKFSSHTELVSSFSEENILMAVSEGKDLYGLQSAELVTIDESYPEFIRKNLMHFEKYIYKKD